MFGSIYTGMSGLTAFSKGLDVISNNVANLNTPGYKGNDLLFQDLFYNYQLSGEHNKNLSELQIGNGVVANSTSVIYQQGDVRETGEDTDVAIQGSGFFVLKDNTNTYYTRSGQFEFDKTGYLVARGTDMRVTARDQSGKITDINITGLKTSSPSATTEIKFTNNLSTGSTRHVLNDIVVIDNAGNEHKLKFTFVNNSSQTPRSWIIEIEDSDGNKIGEKGEIRFQGNGSPEVDFNTFSFHFEPKESDPMDIKLYFGEPGSFTGVTSFSGGTSSDMAVAKKDGAGPGAITSVGFDREGIFKIKYSNGEEYTGASLLLAGFDNPQALQQIGNSLFLAPTNLIPTFSEATLNGMGEIVGKSIELSNVELTQQFTDLIIVQRGYQASSQILTVANEMMQQLMETVGKK